MTHYAPPLGIGCKFKRTLIALSIGTLFATVAQAEVISHVGDTFTPQSDGVYVVDLDRSDKDIDSITIENIEFNDNGPADTYNRPGNGGLRLNRFDTGESTISEISIKNIKQETLGSDIVYYGIKSEFSSISANEIIIDTIKSSGLASEGFLALNTNVDYGTISISNIEGLFSAAGLYLSGSNIQKIKDGDGLIKVSEIKSRDATGAIFNNDGEYFGTRLIVDTVTATGDGIFEGARGVQLDGTMNFDQIGITNVSSTSRIATGLYISGASDFDNQVLYINQVIGQNSYGMSLGDDVSGKHSLNTGAVIIKNIGGVIGEEKPISESRESIGIELKSKTWNGKSIEIDGVFASEEGIATGIKYYVTTNSDSKVIQNLVTIKNVSGGDAYGISNSAQDNRDIVRDLTFSSEEVTIDGISGNNSAFGIHSTENAKMDIHSLTIKNVTGEFSVGLDAEDHSNVQIGNASINPANWTGYQGGYAKDAEEVPLNLNSFAVRSVSGANVTLDGEEVNIYGTIVAGRGVGDSSVDGGVITIGANNSSVNICGDIYAGNGGSVDLTLGAGSVLEGQIDDYHELDSVKDANTVFRNSAFVDADGKELPVTESGSAKLTLNGGTWIARGQNFVRDVAFGTGGGLIDLTKNANSSVSIGNINGQGHFAMNLGAYTEGTDAIETNMLYIQKVGAGSSFTIEAHLDHGVTIEDLEGLRFATVGSVAGGHSGNLFKFVQVTNQGFRNWNLEVITEDYQTDDEENSRYNGDGNGEGVYKPGDDVVDAIFGEDMTQVATLDEDAQLTTKDNSGSKNYVIGTEQAQSTVSDAGQAVIATARSLYYNSVEIDRFNQRYGDRRYDKTNNSLWMRVRHDRWGTDAGVGDFTSKNTTYQLGYDYTQFVDTGKMIYGAAVDLMDGNTDYDSISGSGDTRRYAVSAYATYVGDNGSYLDMIAKVGRLRNEYEVSLDSGVGVSADYDNWMTSLSVETGYQFRSDATRWFLEPQIQAQYAFISSNDYSNGQTKIDQDSIHSFITRGGIRVGRWLDEAKNANVYLKADVLREWAGDQDIHLKDKTTVADGETFGIDNDGTWYDVGFGFQAPISKSFYAYGDAEYRFGNDLDKTWTFNFGGKYVF